MLPGFAEVAITVIDPGTKTVNGSKTPDWDTPDRTLTYDYCWFAPAATEEDNANRQNDVEGVRLLFPPEAVVYVTSKITFADGRAFQIRGRPQYVPSITGNLDYISAYAEKWTG